LEKLVALRFGGLLEFFLRDLVLERFERLRFFNRRSHHLFISLADNAVTDVLAITFPDLVVGFKGEVTRIDDDDHAVLERRKATALGKVAASLLELDLPVNSMEDTVVGPCEPSGPILRRCRAAPRLSSN